MSQSSLYHEHGVSVYRYQTTFYQNGKTYVKIFLPRKEYRCPCCGSDNVWVKETVIREFRSVSVGIREFIIVASIPKFYCHDCHAIRQAPIPFARPKKHYTKRFERYVLSLLKGCTVQFVADLLGVSWATIRDIEKEYLGKHFANPSLKNVKYIAIDEIATKKGHVYMTIVLDLETGLVLYIGEGRDQNALLPFWKKLRKSRAKILAVATDMSPAYTAAVKEHLPDTIHVHDRFHVVKMFNEVISNMRRSIARKIKDKDEKSELKGIRSILLKRPENLDPNKGEPQRLEKALKMNEDLSMIYYLKEELHSLWEEDELEQAQGKLLDLIVFMESTQHYELKRFAKSLRKHPWNILNWYDCPITTGRLEGVNNKIKTIKRQAYGFRDMEYFKLKVLAISRI